MPQSLHWDVQTNNRTKKTSVMHISTAILRECKEIKKWISIQSEIERLGELYSTIAYSLKLIFVTLLLLY